MRIFCDHFLILSHAHHEAWLVHIPDITRLEAKHLPSDTEVLVPLRYQGYIAGNSSSGVCCFLLLYEILRVAFEEPVDLQGSNNRWIVISSVVVRQDNIGGILKHCRLYR